MNGGIWSDSFLMSFLKGMWQQLHKEKLLLERNLTAFLHCANSTYAPSHSLQSVIRLGVSACSNVFINHASCIPSLSCLPFFLYHPYMPLLLIPRIFNLLVSTHFYIHYGEQSDVPFCLARKVCSCPSIGHMCRMHQPKQYVLSTHPDSGFT